MTNSVTKLTFFVHGSADFWLQQLRLNINFSAENHIIVTTLLTEDLLLRLQQWCRVNMAHIFNEMRQLLPVAKNLTSHPQNEPKLPPLVTHATYVSASVSFSELSFFFCSFNAQNNLLTSKSIFLFHNCKRIWNGNFYIFPK